jgi:hypothetical protein
MVSLLSIGIGSIKLRWLRLGGLVHGKHYTFRSPITKAGINRIVGVATASSAPFPMDLDIVRLNFRTKKAYEIACAVERISRGVYDHKIFL